MNRTLPGAYFRFYAVPKPTGAVGDRGIATMPLPLSWGPNGEVIELLSTDLADGKSLTKVGFTALSDPQQSKLARLCLSGCYKLLVWRIDEGGVKAAATVGELTVSAKYSGALGNELKVAVIENEGKKDVVTFLRNEEMDRQTVTKISELVSSDWIDFTGDGALTESAGTPLTGGKDGTVSAENYAKYLAAMKTKQWQVMGIPAEDDTLPAAVTSYINDLRNITGRYVQAVVYNYSEANSVAVISSKQGYQTDSETVSPVEFVAHLTGAAAGCSVNETLCYQLLSGATEIIGELPEDEIEEEIRKGFLMLGRRADGAIVIVDDVNTFTDYSGEMDRDFSDNFVIRLFDEIATTTRLQFERNKIGKAPNTDTGRDALKSQLIANMEALQSLQPSPAIQNFVSGDITVAAGDGMGDVVVTGYVQPAGHMKKLYGTFYKGKRGE